MSLGKKEVTTYLFESRKNFYHIVVMLKNKPGAMAGVASLIAKARINVLSGFMSVESGGRHGTLSVFAEAKTLDADQIKKLVSSSPYAVEVAAKESVEGFISDTFHFPVISSSAKRIILMRQRSFAKMLRGIRETFGSGGEVIQYREGYEIGEALGEEFTHILPKYFKDEHLDQILSLYGAFGWAKTEIVRNDVSTLRILIRMRDSMECVEAKSAEPYSHFIRGHLCGMLTSIFGTDLKCSETKCVAVGDQYCEYAISPAASHSPVA